METIEQKVDTTSFYVIHKDGNGNEVRHLNFNNPKVCPRKGLIELVPLKERKSFDNRISFRRGMDKATGTVVGIPERVDPKTKEFVYKQITIIGRRQYDLTHEKDAQEWACIRLSQYLEGSPNQSRDTAPVYKKYDKEKQAVETISKADVMVKAIQVAQTLNGENLTDMMNACGLDAKGLSESGKQAAMLNLAMRDPSKLLTQWESPERKETFLLKRALSMDIVQMDYTSGMYSYGGVPLGPTEPAAVNYLKEQLNISTAISMLVKQKEQDSISAIEEPKVDNPNALLDEIAELKRQLAEKNSNVITDQLKADGKDKDEEHENLLAEAKELKIKGAHLFDKEKLRAKVEEAKQTNN